MAEATKTHQNPKRFLMVVILFALALRLFAIFATHSYRVVQDDTDHFGFGWEMGRVARSLVEGNGFSSPLPLPTGPTAIVGPAYPLLLALIFKIFGVYSTASSIVIRIVQSIFSSLAVLFIYLCGRDTVGEASGKLAAVVWALFPLNIFFTVEKVWETSLTALLAVILFWCLLHVRDSFSVSRWAGIGFLLAIAALTSTSLVVIVVPFGLAALWRHRARILFPATVGALTCLACVSPWIIRNHKQFGKFILRSNFPLEFRVGNNEMSYGQKVEALHPSNTPSLNVHWQEVGELRYMEEDRDANAQFVSTHPGRFAFATFNRIVNYWTGVWIKPSSDSPNVWSVIIPTTILTLLGWLGLWRMFSVAASEAFLYVSCLFLYPLVYYLTTSQPRFYHAITPFLIVAGSFWVVSFWKRMSGMAATAVATRQIGQTA
jgi:4-amino-4-deoxy-L-arabinose transferase-like glycosyltransferase